MNTLAIFQQLGWVEMVILLTLGLLIFGRRLPEVGRSLGRGIVEFKKGLQGIEDEVKNATPRQPDRLADQAAHAQIADAADDLRVHRTDLGVAARPAPADTPPPSGEPRSNV